MIKSGPKPSHATSEWDFADQFAWDFEKRHGWVGEKLRAALAVEVRKAFGDVSKAARSPTMRDGER